MLVGKNHPVLSVTNPGVGLPEIAIHVGSVDIGVNSHGAVRLNVSDKIVWSCGEIMDKDRLEITRCIVLRLDADSVNSINNAKEVIEHVAYGGVGVSDMDCRDINRNGLSASGSPQGSNERSEGHIKTFTKLVINIEFSLFLICVHFLKFINFCLLRMKKKSDQFFKGTKVPL